ncbi:MAG: response regulator [Chloroflexota bacterium]|nr:response regulator [Chloroflexota bacterium]
MITIVIEFAFGAIFVAALVAFSRRPRRLELDVVLVFATIATLFALQALNLVGLTMPTIVQTLAVSVLIAHAPLSLRLAADLAPVPRRLIIGSWIVFVAVSISLTFAIRVPAVFLIAIGYFFVVDGVAAFFMAGGARRRGGSAQIRLWAAAAGTGLIAVTLLVLVGTLAGDGIGRVATAGAQVGALASAVAYLAAFLPPRWLRGLWQSRSGLRGTQRLLASTSDRDGGAWWTFADLAIELSGADGAAVFTGRTDGTARRVASAGTVSQDPSSIDADAWTAMCASPTNVRDGAAASLPDPLRALAALESPATTSVLGIPGSGAEQVVVVLVHRYQSLFGDDEEALLVLLGSQAASLAEREAALAEAAALTARLGETVDALRTASQAKSDFLASMSHELRTPLNAILGFSDLMRSEPAEEERRAVPSEWIEHVNSAGRHLLDLINDVLDLSKVEAGRIELHPATLDLRLAVGEALAGVRPLADRKRLVVTSELATDRVLADPGRFRQILYNLLSNAIKFTGDGGSVIVSASQVGLNGTAEVHVGVTDTGVGIAHDDVSRVFEEFVQVGDPTERQQGTGLGLALTRRLVEAHGGRLELNSELGRGSTFTVILPVGGAVSLPPSPLGTAVGDRRMPALDGAAHVLLIEDDPQAIRLIAHYLEPTGHRLVTAANGIDGVAAARRHRPEAILLDILLPDIDGWEVLRRLKADPQLRDTPVVVVTVVDEREMGLALGAADYLLKPVDRDALVSALDRCLPPARDSATVLAIDDDPATLALLRATLEPTGANVLTAEGGREGLEIARDGGLDLVICDLLMPEIDGFEVVAQLKASPATADTPILVLTGHELTAADKQRLNGQVVGLCQKGPSAGDALRTWLAAAVLRSAAPNGAGVVPGG